MQFVANDAKVGDQGWRPGDVVVNANGTMVGTPDDVESAIRTARDAHQVYVPFLVSGKYGLHWLSHYTRVKESG